MLCFVYFKLNSGFNVEPLFCHVKKQRLLLELFFYPPIVPTLTAKVGYVALINAYVEPGVNTPNSLNTFLLVYIWRIGKAIFLGNN